MSTQPASCAICDPVRATWRGRAAQALLRTLSSWSWETLSTSGYFDILLAGQAAFSYEAESRDNDTRERRQALIARDALGRSPVWRGPCVGGGLSGRATRHPRYPCGLET
ncbi:MAG: hypothetical protein ACRYHA_21915 [Janthinobacterium lividum]